MDTTRKLKERKKEWSVTGSQCLPESAECFGHLVLYCFYGESEFFGYFFICHAVTFAHQKDIPASLR